MRLGGSRIRGALLLLLGTGCLAGAEEARGDDFNMIRISATVSVLDPDDVERILGVAEVTTVPGEWARFRNGQDVPSVAEYSAPSIPEGVSKSVTGESGDAPEFETNQLNLVIPSHPEKVETIELGLSGRFRPRLLSDGSLVVDVEIEHGEVEEWIEKANPIFYAKRDSAGKEKKVLITENRTREPAIRSRKFSGSYAQEAGGKSGVAVPHQKAGGDASLVVRLEIDPVVNKEAEGKAIPPENDFHVSTRFIEISMSDSELDDADLNPEEPFLSGQEFEKWIRRISQQKGVDLLTAPSIVMRPGVEGKVEVLREFVYPTAYDPPVSREGEPIPPATPTAFETKMTGVSMSLRAKRAKQKGYVEISVQPRVDQFREFVNFGKPVHTWNLVPLGPPQKVVISENEIQHPVFERISMQVLATVPDGSTLVFGGVSRDELQIVEDKVPILGDLPLIGKFGRSRSELLFRKKLFFVVTVQSVDSSGRPVN